MKKFLFIFLLISFTALAQNTQDVPQLLKASTKNFFEDDSNGYPAYFLARMSQQERKELSELIQKYDAEPTNEQKTWKELIEHVYEKCPDNANSLPTNTSILNPNVMFGTPDRIIIDYYGKSPNISREWYERALARQELAKFIANKQEEIYAYATLFCPRNGLKIRSEANMSSKFSYKEFYDKLSKEEQQELDRLVYISERHLKRLKELGLVTTYMAFILQDVPQLIHKDFIRENPQLAEIATRCQDECHVHDLYEQRRADGISESENQTWENYAKEYAKAHIKTPIAKCENKDCPCHKEKGTFYEHRQSFIEVADNIENLKGKTVVFLEDGSRDEIDITDGIAYSLSNGRIVVFPESADDGHLRTAALFYSQETAKNLAKECQKDQFYGVLPGHNVFEGRKCYPREEVEKHSK